MDAHVYSRTLSGITGVLLEGKAIYSERLVGDTVEQAGYDALGEPAMEETSLFYLNNTSVVADITELSK